MKESRQQRVRHDLIQMCAIAYLVRVPERCHSNEPPAVVQRNTIYAPLTSFQQTDVQAGGLRFGSRKGLRPISCQPSIRWVLRVRRPGRDADHIPLSSIKVTNASPFCSSPANSVSTTYNTASRVRMIDK
jgi:hypothetical protein